MNKPAHAPPRRYRGQSPGTRQAQRRQQLLEAALAVIANRGFSSMTIKRVCEAAGLTERYFYESFRNREDLLGQLYLQQTDSLSNTMYAALEEPVSSADHFVRNGLGAFFDFVQDQPAAARLVLFEVLAVNREIDRLYYQAMEDFAALVQQLAHRQNIATIQPPADEAMVYAGLVGAVVQIAQRWVMGGYRQRRSAVVESAALIFTATANFGDQKALEPSR